MTIRYFIFSLCWICGFQMGNTTYAQNLQATEVENIKAFAKLYGYVRWFHPSDEAQTINWNRFAGYGVSFVKNATTSEELAQRLSTLFAPIAPSLSIYQEGQPAPPKNPSLSEDADGLMPISWIHYGLETNPNNQFKSLRTNRKSGEKPSEKAPEFGNITASIPLDKANPGTRLRVTAAAKMASNSAGSGHIWARISRADGQIGFMENMDKNPISKTEWDTYTLTGDIASDAISLSLGAFLKGPGGIYLDDFKVEIEKDGQWQTLAIPNQDFEESYMGGWRFQGLQHKVTFPTENAYAGNQSLLIATKSRPKAAVSAFEKALPFGTAYTADIGRGLQISMPIVVMGDADNTFPIASQQALKSLKDSINHHFPKGMKVDDQNARLASIIVGWNIMQHFHPYKEQFKVDWEAHLVNGIQLAAPPSDLAAFRKSLEQFLAPTQDGHFWIFHPADKSEAALPPISWSLVDNQLVIDHVLTDEIPVIVGDIVLQIDGKAPQNFLRQFEELTAASTPAHFQYRLLHRALKGPFKSTISLKVQHADGQKETYELRRSISRGIYYREYYAGATKPYREIDRKTLYIDLVNFPWSEMEAELETFAKYENLIFDLRGYPQNNHFILSHLLKRPDTAANWMKIPGFEFPDQQNITKGQVQGWNLNPQRPTLDANVIFLTNVETTSYSESMIGLVKHYQLGKTVGENTAGINGQINNFTLPGGFVMAYTGMKVTRPDGGQHFQVGYAPDIEAHPTLEGLQNGRDDILEAALQALQK